MIKHKNFSKNNEDAYTSVAAVLCLLISALVISTFFISTFLAMTNAGTTVSAISMPTGISTYSSNQNFLDCSINSSTWSKNLQSKWSDVCGVGEVLVWVMEPRVGRLVLENEVPDSSGNYVNTYIINNSPLSDYYIELRYTGSTDTNEIYVDSKGFHIPNYIIQNPLAGVNYQSGDLFFYPYEGADLVQNPTIKTIYNDAVPSLQFYFNNQLLFTTSNLKENGWNPFNLFTHYMGGVGSYSIGFTLENYNTDNTISVNSDSLLGTVWDFISSYLKILVFSIPASIDPLGYGNMIYRLLEGCTFIALIVLLRG